MQLTKASVAVPSHHNLGGKNRIQMFWAAGGNFVGFHKYINKYASVSVCNVCVCVCQQSNINAIYHVRITCFFFHRVSVYAHVTRMRHAFTRSQQMVCCQIPKW